MMNAREFFGARPPCLAYRIIFSMRWQERKSGRRAGLRGASPENTLSRGAGQNVVRLSTRDAPEARSIPTIAVGARRDAGFES